MYSSTFRDGVPGEFLSTITPESVIGFAGSRHLELDSKDCLSFVTSLASKKPSFSVGCAPGVDSSFLKTLSVYYPKSSLFFRAFEDRSSLRLRVAYTSSARLRPARALASRTRALVSACTHIVLFPGDWGPGSKLCLRLAKEKELQILVVEE